MFDGSNASYGETLMHREEARLRFSLRRATCESSTIVFCARPDIHIYSCASTRL
eukprot:SAG31_NODE_905_length_11119_cov_2.887931_3_plen_54_part_00